MRSVSSDTLIGRDEPLRVLDGVLAAAADGRPALVLVSGEAGVGKTRLAAAAEALARERGATVLHGECMEFGGEEFPYAPLAAALRDLPPEWLEDAPAELAGLLPGPAPAVPALSGPYGQGRLCELVLELLGGLSRERAPLAIVLEDVHWADRSSRDLIEFLARNLRDERLALVLTYRTGELERGDPLRRLVAALGRRTRVTRVELAPLDREHVALQLEAIAHAAVPVRTVDEVHARSGGNPFFVEELFAAGRDDIPAALTEVVAARVARLSPAATAVVRVVAATGGRASYDLLSTVAGADGLGAAVREALDAGFLLRDGGDRGLALRHGLIGEVVLRDLLPAERARLHREIARVLAAGGAPPARLAHHWYRAGAREEALAASLRAGEDAMRVSGFAEALGHLERALTLSDPASVDLLAATAHAARYTGERERAVELVRRALELETDPVRSAGLYGRLGEYQYWDDAASLECYRTALELLGPEPSAERSAVLAAEGHALMGMRRWEEARVSCEAALECAGPAEEPVARSTLGLVLAFLGDADAGEAELRRALELPLSEHTPRAYVHLGELERLRGDHAAAFEAMREGEDAATRLGMRATFGHFMFVNGAADLLLLGRWSEAAERVEVAERLDLGLTTRALQHAVAGELCALRGDADRAREWLDEGLALTRGLPREFVAPIHAARATLALVAGDPVAAGGEVSAGLDALGSERDPLYTPPLHALGVRAQAEAAARSRRGAEPDAADALLADLERTLRVHDGAVPPDALAHRAAALAERGRLRGASDPAAWREVAGRWDALGEPHPAAYARLREAEALLAGDGDRRAARDLLAAVRDAAASRGARPLAEDAEALARRARLSLTAAAPRPDEDELLTRREADVLRLLIDGLTNREIAERLFISQKTVGTHVGHIFDKLDAHNRVEAVARARELGVLG